jgi:hypothetical protein
MQRSEEAVNAAIEEVRAALRALDGDPDLEPKKGKQTSEEEWKARLVERLGGADTDKNPERVKAELDAIVSAMVAEM